MPLVPQTPATTGDLSTLQPPRVTGLRGRNIADVAPTTGQVLEWDGHNWLPKSLPNVIRTLNAIVDGAGSVLSTGIAGDVFIDFACTITKATLLADQSGSIVIDIWKAPYGSFPPTVSNTITASDLPTLSSATKAQDTSLTGWTTSISAGDVLRFNINSVTSITRIDLALTLQG